MDPKLYTEKDLEHDLERYLVSPKQILSDLRFVFASRREHILTCESFYEECVKYYLNAKLKCRKHPMRLEIMEEVVDHIESKWNSIDYSAPYLDDLDAIILMIEKQDEDKENEDTESVDI